MIGKLITLPFWIICRILGLFAGSIRLVFMLIAGIGRFLFSHILGTIIGATIGFLLGRKHVGVKLFHHHHKWSKKKK